MHTSPIATSPTTSSIRVAILWHGGEGRRARNAFASMSAADQEALLAFLRSL